jgi:hypothetical protein
VNLARRLVRLLGPPPPRRTGGRHPRRSRLLRLAVVCGLVTASLLVGGVASADPFDCKSAPEPDRPGSGLVGSLDQTPRGTGEPGSVYAEVGYAGLVWHTYDLGCGGSVTDPSVATDTWLGNETFNLAKFVIGGVNWAHYLLAQGGDVLTPLDTVVAQATKAMYQGVFTTYIGPALLLLALILLVLALRGELAKQAQRVGLAALALMLGSAAYLAPVNWATAADGLLLGGVTQMQQGFLSTLGQGDVNTLPTVLTDEVVYDNWLRGEFGSPTDPTAVKYGRDLLRAQTFTKDELATGHTQDADVQAKQQQFATVAGQLGDRYPYFQGKAGSRIGDGVLAVIQAVCLGLFQLMSKVLVLVAMLLIRLLIMCLPVIAVLAVLRPDVLPTVARVAGSALVNTLVVGAMAGLHALLVVSLFKPGNNVDQWLALLITGVTTVVLWAVARPFRRLAAMVSLTGEQFGGVVPGAGSGPMSRMWRRMRGGAEADERQDRWWGERRADAERPGDPHTVRPESVYAPTVQATATVVPEQRYGRRADSPDGIEAGRREALEQRRRRALTGGAAAAGTGGYGTGGYPGGHADPNAIDESTLYRRAESAVPERRRNEPVAPEMIDGVPVYRIYRPRPAYPYGDRGEDRAGPEYRYE